jgi:hypothetical protein
MKLESLTKEQEKIMIETRDEWIDLYFDNVKNKTGINKALFEEGISWLYTDLLGKQKPKVVYCDSWISCLISIAILKEKKQLTNTASVRDSVWDSVGASVWDSVRASVGDSVTASVTASVRASVGDSVTASVGDSVTASVTASVGASVTASVRASVWEYSGYIDLSNYGWVSFYDFFENINVLDNFKFKQYKKILKSGVFNAYEYENIVFAIQPPVQSSTNIRGQLHNVNEASVIFRDDSKYYFVNGRSLPENVFIDVITEKYTSENFFKEQNEETKSAVIALIQEKFGEEHLFNFIRQGLTEIDTYVDRKDPKYLEGTTKGMNVGVYTLFKGIINDESVAYVRCYCPSTDRMFFLGVMPEHTNAKDAIASLYRVPKKLSKNIKYIQRQGERFSTVFDELGTNILKSLKTEDIQNTTSITGEEYFSKIRYEF